MGNESLQDAIIYDREEASVRLETRLEDTVVGVHREQREALEEELVAKKKLNEFVDIEVQTAIARGEMEATISGGRRVGQLTGVLTRMSRLEQYVRYRILARKGRGTESGWR